MCGGTILGDLIPRNRSHRVSAADLWPSSTFNFTELNYFQEDSRTLERAQPHSAALCQEKSMSKGKLNCNCGKPVVQKYCWKTNNAGRRFFRCLNWNEEYGVRVSGCNFFEWIDGPLCDRAIDVIPELIQNLKAQDKTLEAKDKALETMNMALTTKNGTLLEKDEDLLKLVTENSRILCELQKMRSFQKWTYIIILLIGVLMYYLRGN